MTSEGAQIEDFHPWKAIWRRYEIFHLHWPEYYVIHPNPIIAFVGTLGVLGCISWLRLRGTKVIWTVHNLRSHTHPRPRTENLFWALFTRLIDGFLALTPAGLDQAREHFPRLRTLPGFVTPVGMYEGVYPNTITRGQARDQLQIGPLQPLVLFLGVIARYKNIPTLVQAFRGLRDEDARLVIAGRFNSDEDETASRRAAEGDGRIQIHPGYVHANDLQIYLNAADLVVLPFREILNSGSALLALSFHTPVLVPALGSMSDLQASFGLDWVRTYEGELTTEKLAAALEWSTRPDPMRQPRASAMSWEEAAQETLRAYTRVLEGSHLVQPCNPRASN